MSEDDYARALERLNEWENVVGMPAVYDLLRALMEERKVISDFQEGAAEISGDAVANVMRAADAALREFARGE